MKAALRPRKIPQSSMPRQDGKGRLDFASVNRLSQEQTTAWITRRLQGHDRLCPPDERLGAAWQDLIAGAYNHRRATDETCRRIRRALLEIGALFSRWPVGGGWQPFAIESFLDLASEVFAGSREMSRMARLVLQAVEVLPWSAKSRGSMACDLKAAALQCLIDLEHREKPEAWESRWGRGRHPEIIGLVFEGIQRGAGYRAAFRWLGRARPWDAEHVLDALDARWGQLLHDCGGQEGVREMIEGEMMPGMDMKACRELANWLLSDRNVELKLREAVEPTFGQLAEIVGVPQVELMLDEHSGSMTMTYTPAQQQIIENLRVIHGTMEAQNPSLGEYNRREMGEAAWAALQQPQNTRMTSVIKGIMKNIQAVRRCA